MVTRCTSWAYVAAVLLLTGVSTATAKYSGGTGEPNDPYQITTAADLIALGETPDDYDKHFILTADIDLDPNLPGRKVFDKAVIHGVFTGVFDGDGHTISDLTIIGESYLGLFSELGNWDGGPYGYINNLGLVDANITGSGSCVGGLVGASYGPVSASYSTGTICGRSSVGGLVGYNYSDQVTRCHSTACVRGSGQDVGGLVGSVDVAGTVTHCYSTGTVSGNEHVGGLVGSSLFYVGYISNLTQCYSTGAVNGNASVGGLVGLNECRVTQCYSTGAVNGNARVGGLVGLNVSRVTQCYSTGKVSGSENVGGLMGYNLWDEWEWPGSVADCFWDIETSGQAESAGGTGKTTAEMQTASTFLGAGWDFVGETANGTEDIWKIAEGLGYPRLAWQKYSGGTGEPNDPYQIATAADLMALGETPEDYDKHFILTADIDLDPNLPDRKVFGKAVIAPDSDSVKDGFQGTAFTGAFDGNDHSISDLTITGKDYLGLFGVSESGAKVKNLGIVDANVVGSGYDVGGLVGSNSGAVTQCHSSGLVIGGDCVGGFVGFNYYGSVTQCYSTGVVSGGCDVGGLVGANGGGRLRQCHSAAAVNGGSGVGGIVAWNDWCGEVTDCYSTGIVAGGSCVGGVVGASGSAEHGDAPVTDCYSTGAVSGTDFVGGLVGDHVMGSVRRCYSLGSVSGGSYVGGLVGRGGAVDCWSMSPVRGTGKQVGGLVGWNWSDVTQCYSGGTVSGDSEVGGLVGYAERTDGSLTHCYSTGLVTGRSSVGGLVGATASPETTVTACFWDIQTSGQTMSAGGTGKTTAEMQDPNTFMAAGWDFVGQTDGPQDIWAEPQGGGYPIFSSQLPPLQGLPGFSGGSGDPNDPYRISTVKDLNSIGHNPRLMQRHFKLVADLDLAGVHFYPIGDYYHPYGGTFDGNGHTVSHLTIKGVGDVGMFGWLAGEVKSLGVADVNITGSGWYVGGLVGYNQDGGSVTQCYSTGAISGFGDVGGLVGHNSDNGSVADCYSIGTVSGKWSVGMLVGTNWGMVTRCYSAGRGGLVGGPGYVGGSATACFCDTGNNTAKMQTASTFLDAGWDFVGETANGTEDIWKIAEGLDYPRLWWEPYDGRVTVVLGQIFTVTLESNPSTGYRWEWVDHQDSIVEQIGQAQFKPRETGDPPLVGAGGWESFDFKAVHQGQMTLKLVYRRPWEAGVEALKTFSLQVAVP